MFLRGRPKPSATTTSYRAGLANGRSVRVRRGAYVLVESTPTSLTARYRPLLPCGGSPGRTPVVLSHTSSLALGLSLVGGVPDGGPPDTGGRGARSGAMRRSVLTAGPSSKAMSWSTWAARHVPGTGCPRYTTIADVEHSLVEIDDLLHRKLVDLADLRARYAAMTQWPGPDHRSGAASGGRSQRVRGRDTSSLPGVVPRTARPGGQLPDLRRARREVARVDLAWPNSACSLSSTGRSSTNASSSRARRLRRRGTREAT